MQRLGLAKRYVGSRQHGITTTETTLIKNAKDALQQSLNAVNTFFIEDWTPYEAAMKQVEPDPFKTIKTFTLD